MSAGWIQNRSRESRETLETDSGPAVDTSEPDESANREECAQIREQLKETWRRLSDEDIALYDDDRDRFFARVYEKYGFTREEAEDRLAEIAGFRSGEAA